MRAVENVVLDMTCWGEMCTLHCYGSTTKKNFSLWKESFHFISPAIFIELCGESVVARLFATLS